ncbi:oxygen-independent coproporphyrinogen III oxidase [Aurantiacibacter sp. MUD11]|uniref:oxygen-independent coproporphyrinogen III oxidase n=1 Tax=Aurantiacibacter sp. MUD11 TaxID=3003265 RepID=UPI0022AA3AEA|nr:oxygen-independent coproporphyrinogen III oxidase [Aurantiacibacter sp. MUD11]WAT18185.1 oxygen-independent coproporphyrinogen III oxidase [Aurantiacibacter sp. MUD11]
MWTYYPELLARPVPRYTSFPTAAEFGTDVGEADLLHALEDATGHVSLYVHIPFCEKICWYCGCNTAAANRASRLASYMDALHSEIALMAERLPRSAKVRRIAFGGGSPNAITPDQFLRLFDDLAARFPLEEPVVSIELDPRSLTAEWTNVLANIGASHASMGVQTFAPKLQAAIGRVQPTEMIERGVDILRKGGVTSLNFDLMYGLPGQDQDDVSRSLDLAAQFGADRIALFGYAHVPHMIARQRRIDDSALPGAEERFAMAWLGYQQLQGEGYVPVGFDHFALPGDPLAQAAEAGTLRRNFQGFTEDTAPVLLGLGASAISGFPGLLAQNDKNSGRYRMLLSQGHLPVALGRRRTAEDQRRGKVVEQLLCNRRTRIDAALMMEAQARLSPYIERGLCEISGGILTISDAALPYARSIAAAFDPYRPDSPRIFSSAI